MFVILHEIFHILAFSPVLYDRFKSQPATDKVTRKVNGEDFIVTRLITPKLVAEAKKHFNCSTLKGVLLEN